MQTFNVWQEQIQGITSAEQQQAFSEFSAIQLQGT
jgi:hypothetical protein